MRKTYQWLHHWFSQHEHLGQTGSWVRYTADCTGILSPSCCIWMVPGTFDPMED